MDATYWQKQTDKPLFEDILWSRPQNRMGAGKLLIIGGNKFGFAAPATAYSGAYEAAIGAVKVLLPNSLNKLIGSGVFDAEFAPDNISGSFSASALEPMLNLSAWADCVMLAGELGKNSETAALLEKYASKYSGKLALTKDCVDYFFKTPQVIMDRANTLIVLNIEQLQKLASASKFSKPIAFGMDSTVLSSWLHEFSLLHKAVIVTLHNNQLFVAENGQVISQKAAAIDDKIWRVTTCAWASVFWLQNQNQPLRAIATSFLRPKS